MSKPFTFFCPHRQIQRLCDAKGAKCEEYHHHRPWEPAMLGAGLHVVSTTLLLFFLWRFSPRSFKCPFFPPRKLQGWFRAGAKFRTCFYRQRTICGPGKVVLEGHQVLCWTRKNQGGVTLTKQNQQH